MEGKKKEGVFTREDIVVIQAVEHILNNDKPNAHYYITEATKIIAFLKRIVPTRWLDEMIRKQ